jgi:hypothetical protein
VEAAAELGACEIETGTFTLPSMQAFKWLEDAFQIIRFDARAVVG